VSPTSLSGLSAIVVEDDLLLRKRIQAQLEREGVETSACATLREARRLLTEAEFDLALLDVNLPDGNGLDLLRQGAFPPSTAAVVMTAQGGVSGAVEAMRLGAADYLAKPFDLAELPLVLRRARASRRRNRAEEHRRESELEPDGLFFGESLKDIRRQLEKILDADRRLQTNLPPVLIIGETGTGKTTLARWIHRQGPRADGPCVEVNCSALPESLAESELFGHEKGAFTDARARRIGLFEAADGGTLFLDELPSLSLPLQAKVLSAIEDGLIRRVGGARPVKTDARVIAAAQRDLRELVAEGRFREDLYHRLDLFRVRLPPLRERGEDILQLAELFLARLCRRYGVPLKRISPEGRRRLLAYRWPGNIRELSHELERAVVFAEEEELHFEHLPVALDEEEPPTAPSRAAQEGETSRDWLNPEFVFPPSGFSLEAAIQRLIRRALDQTGGNVSAAARLLGVSRDYLRYRLSGRRRSEK